MSNNANRYGRCVALDSGGHRCRRLATHADSYHGDGEIYYNDNPGWVRVVLCETHRISEKPRKRKAPSA